MGRLALRPGLRAYAHAPAGAEEPFDNTKCMEFDGVNESADATLLHNDPIVGTGSYSISLWLNAPNGPAKHNMLVLGDVLWRSDFGTYYSYGRIRIHMSQQTTSAQKFIINERKGGASGTDRQIDTNYVTTSGAWNHLVVTSDYEATNGLKVYVNGNTTPEEQGTGPPWAQHATGDKNKFAIANYHATHASGQFPGKVDEVGIWAGTVLSTSDVTALYNGGGSGIPGDLSEIAGGPTHWFRMGDNVTGSTMTDVVGSYEVTLHNSPTISTDVPS